MPIESHVLHRTHFQASSTVCAKCSVHMCAYTVVMEMYFELDVYSHKICQQTLLVMGAKRGFCIFMASMQCDNVGPLLH